MPLSDFTVEVASTRLGAVRLSTTPTPSNARPVLVAIPGVLSAFDEMISLMESVAFFADACMLSIPLPRDAPLASYAVPDLSAMVGEVIESRFAGRPVVLFGASSGAVIALGVRAKNLARVVAVEPPLLTEGLWPITKPLIEDLRATRNPAWEAFASASLGVSLDGPRPRDHLAVLDETPVPVDVVLGGTPLRPERDLPVFPSLVDEPVRRRLAATPGVRLWVIDGAGHNVVGQAAMAVREVVLEACRRAAARLSRERLAVDEPLLDATPLSARRLLHWGPRGEAFSNAFRALNPGCEVTCLGEDLARSVPGEGQDFDTLVLAAPPPAAMLARLAERLALSGHMVARWALDRAALQAELAPHGLVAREPVDLGGTGVIRAQKLPPGATPRSALFLKTVAYASHLMDIRTRLPAQALASEPELRVVYGPPPISALPSLPLEAPKVLVLQRPAEVRPEPWLPLLVRAVRQGWVVVMEYDDYPPLVSEVLGKPRSALDLQRFGYVHGVQTSAPPLVELFRPYNPETVLFPNCAFDLPPFPRGPRAPRVFYGAVIRGRYATEIAASLGPALARRPDAEFIVIGDRDVFDALPTQSKQYYDYMSFEGYLDLMSQCAVSLSPIEALPFRDTKSDAKFVDAARGGALTIASPTIYDRVIRHGENGLLAREVADWAPLLEQALTDEPGRERMARRAWEEVRDGRLFAHQSATRRDWYWSLWERREALNAALIERVPGLREALSASA